MAQKIAPAIIWVTALLATMLSLDNLFRSDFEDGSLEQMQQLGIQTGRDLKDKYEPG